MNESDLDLFTYKGFIPFLPNIMSPVKLDNSSELSCICGDIQEEDYSPLYSWFNYILIICLLPWLSIFGLLTNVCNVFIFSRKRMITSANSYLFFLACSDFLVILTGVFIFWVDSARSYIRELHLAPYTGVYILPIGYMAQTCSIYYTVSAAVDCWVNVCWKSQAKNYCTVRRARQIVGTITVCSILYNSMRFPQFNLRKCLPDGGQEFVIEICPTTLFFAINTLYNVYLYMVLMTLLPFLFLLVLNVFIVARQSTTEPVSSTSRRTSLSENPNGKNNCKPTAEVKTPLDSIKGASNASPPSSTDDTITMIMVVVLFLCCNTLALVVNLIETFGSPDPILLNLLSDASNFLVVFNSSVNCLIYFIFNKEYRDLFLRYYLVIRRNCCSKQKTVRGGPTEVYKNGSSNVPPGHDGMFTRCPNTRARTSRKTDMASSRLETDSPIWRRQTNLPSSNTTITKFSFPENEPPTCNGDLQSPGSSFTPLNYDELLLMDDTEGGVELETTLPTAIYNPIDALNNNGPRQPYQYMAELTLSDIDKGTSKPHMTVITDKRLNHKNTGSTL